MLIGRNITRTLKNFDNKRNRKLTKWCGTTMETKENQNRVIILSNTKISEEIQHILNLGLNCHLKTKTIQSKIEMEKLMQQLE